MNMANFTVALEGLPGLKTEPGLKSGAVKNLRRCRRPSPPCEMMPEQNLGAIFKGGKNIDAPRGPGTQRGGDGSPPGPPGPRRNLEKRAHKRRARSVISLTARRGCGWVRKSTPSSRPKIKHGQISPWPGRGGRAIGMNRARNPTMKKARRWKKGNHRRANPG